MPRLPSISALKAFESAARRLSFKHAAEELHLTPGAISRQIQALEDTLGMPLFTRGRRLVALTQAGEAYLADIGPPLAALRAAGDRAAAIAAAPVVSVVTYPTFAVRWLIPRWGRFLDAHPDIDLRLTTTLSPVDFARGDADFAIHVADSRALETAGPHWKLFDVDLFPVASPALGARLRRPADLAGETLLQAAPRPDDWPRWLASVEAEGLSSQRTLNFESQNLAMQAAIEGLGLAIAFDPIVSDDIKAGRLVRPFREVRRSSRALYLVESTARPASAPALVPASASAARALVRAWLVREATADNSTPSA